MHDKGDRSLAAVLARAEAAVADLAKNYGPSAMVDVDSCAALLKIAREQPVSRAGQVKEIYNIAHNIKGQGSSFGYPLVTRIGHSLCIVTRLERDFSDSDLALIQAHVDALRLILTREIKGDGGAVGEKLAARLEGLVEKVRG